MQLDYITPEEEWELITRIDAEPWQSNYRRRVQQYGFGYASGTSGPRWENHAPMLAVPQANLKART